MIKLQHVSAADGWAIAVENGIFSLISPPYRPDNIIHLNEERIYDLLKTGYFIESTLEFRSIADLTRHLNDIVRQERLQYAPLRDDKSVAAQALEVASEGDLLRFLTKIDVDLIQRSSLDQAEEIIIKIISLNSDSITKAVRSKAANLLTTITSKRARQKGVLLESVDISRKYPGSTSRHGKEALIQLAELLSQRRSIFAFSPS
ncbi:hypothetical protein LRS73_00995 [Methylobacterium currus]|uniref:hypothetical protein n=1 Tax=Methylobacterium currus TaxID=2051553 RepID=UPI001E5995C3|nr:hypothetical protein [Methylobacterium currus]UHC16548.1 hypothetical protein LRS73_00995 [Methylobacterium currus]